MTLDRARRLEAEALRKEAHRGEEGVEWMRVDSCPQRTRSDSDPAEHYEFQVGWHLGSQFAKRPNVFVRFDRHMRQWFGTSGVANREKFELTLMQVENGDLKELERKPMLPEQPSE